MVFLWFFLSFHKSSAACYIVVIILNIGSQMKAIYHDYFSYLMDENVTTRKMARELWDELDDTRPFGASLQQEVPNWPWATKLVVS